MTGDASFEASFGDSSHAGWTSLNIGGGADGFTRVRPTASDAASGQVFIAIATGDGNLHGCSGILRLIPDRLFGDRFDGPPSTPSGPQWHDRWVSLRSTQPTMAACSDRLQNRASVRRLLNETLTHNATETATRHAWA